MPPEQDPTIPESVPSPELDHLLVNQDDHGQNLAAIGEHQLQATADTTEAVKDLEPVLEHIFQNTIPKDVQKVEIQPSSDEHELATTFFKMLRGPGGPQGEPGMDGAQGAQGEPGPQGLVGMPGMPGDTGPRGPRGLTGPKGDRGDDGSVGPAGPKGERGPKGADGSPDTGEQIIEKIDGKLSYYALKDVPDYSAIVQRAHVASRDYALGELTDVSTTGVTDGQVLKYSAAAKGWRPGTSTGGSSSFISLTDTPSSYTGQAGKAVRVNTGETALEFFTAAGTGTVTSVASADGSITVTSGTTTPDLAVVKAPKLSTARTINGVNFDGTANITVTVSSAQIAAALGFTPYNAANPSGYIANATGLVTQGTGVTVTGSGTAGAPYVVSSTPVSPTTSTTTSTSTLSPDLSVAKVYFLTAQAAALTIAAPANMNVGDVIAIYVTTAAAQALTFNAAFVAYGAALPATTTAGKTTLITAQYTAASNWSTLVNTQV